MVDSNEHGDPGNTREAEPTAHLAFPGGLVTLGDRVQQPGELIPEPPLHPGAPHKQQPTQPFPVAPMASDKFSVVALVVDQTRAYQLVPADTHRMCALVLCFGNAVILGDESSVNNALGFTFSNTAVQPGCFVLPPSNMSSGQTVAFEYTSKQGLWCASAVPGTVAPVQAMVERFESGTPVR